MGVTASQAGTYFLMTELVAADGRPLASGSLDPAILRSSPRLDVTLNPGSHLVPVYFNGQNLRSAEVAGPYTVRVQLTDGQGAPRTRPPSPRRPTRPRPSRG
ncbi:hypothetical protein ACN28S_18765 [Cystobacter fuscus]